MFWVGFWARLEIISTVSLKHILEVHWCLYFGVEKGKIYWQTSAYYKNNLAASVQAAFAVVFKRVQCCLTRLHLSGGTWCFYFTDCSVSHAAFWSDPTLFLQLPFEHDQSFLPLRKRLCMPTVQLRKHAHTTCASSWSERHRELHSTLAQLLGSGVVFLSL